VVPSGREQHIGGDRISYPLQPRPSASSDEPTQTNRAMSEMVAAEKAVVVVVAAVVIAATSYFGYNFYKKTMENRKKPGSE